MRSNKKPIVNQSNLKNLLRLEISYRNPYYIGKLKKEYQLLTIAAENLLTINIAEAEIHKAKELISFDNHIPDDVTQIHILLANYGARYATTLYGFLKLIEDYDFNFYELNFLDYPARTYRKHLQDCKAAGISHYE